MNIDTETTITEIPLSEAEGWLRCYTAMLVDPQSKVGWCASDADKALEEYKKRYGDEIQ